ncbi:unnamed protein product [Diamesa hyperborea]
MSKSERTRSNRNISSINISRTRYTTKLEEEQMELNSVHYKESNSSAKRENAALIAYLNMLTEVAGEEPKDWRKIADEMMEKERKKLETENADIFTD